MRYLIYISKSDSDHRAFNNLKRRCHPVKVLVKNNVIYLSGTSNDEIELATASILNDPLVNGLLIDLIQVKANPSLIHKKISHIRCNEVRCILNTENDDKCEVLLFSRNSVNFHAAQKLLKSFIFQQQSYTQIVDSHWISSASDCLDNLPVVLKVLPNHTPELHGLIREDIDEAWGRIVPTVERLEIRAVTVSHCINEFQQEADRHSCHIVVPPNCDSLPLNKLVEISISGCRQRKQLSASN